MLLFAASVSFSQTKNDSICFSFPEVLKIDKTISDFKQCEFNFSEASKAAVELHTIIVDLNKDLTKSFKDITDLNASIKAKTEESEKKAKEIAKLKEQQKRFGIGPAVIYGIGKDGLGGFVGIGVNYDLIRF